MVYWLLNIIIVSFNTSVIIGYINNHTLETYKGNKIQNSDKYSNIQVVSLDPKEQLVVMEQGTGTGNSVPNIQPMRRDITYYLGTEWEQPITT